MRDTRNEIISKYYTDINLHSSYMDLYIVRKNIAEAVRKNLKNFQGRVLDVGCGIMPYKEIILSNTNVTSYEGLDFANPINQQYEIAKPDYFWDGVNIPLPNNSVNTIIATEIFEHCPNVESVMKEMVRVLNYGGIIFFTVPFFWYLHLSPYDEYRYTPFSLQRHLSNAGFTDISIKRLGGLDASLAQMLTIWYSNRPLSLIKKKLLFYCIKPLVKVLLKKEKYFKKDDQFTDGEMVTGFYGVAMKN